ncbi:ATP-binding cassette domain-containing protein, partial [Streptomyces sp. tea 10]|nr:ATP-binding cassette domain-containing protein [Streptomyces sp. tea 10]
HMTVAENMGFALKIAKVNPEERRRRVEEAAKILDLTQYLDRKPKALSGGQRQRVAMGRAIVRSPQVFLMDEPLSNLDAKLRVQTRTQIASLTRRLGVTTVYVTHDQVEAMTMGDRVAVLKDGVLMQVDTPRNLYDRPNSEFVAGFIGSPAMNLFRAPVSPGHVELGTLSLQLSSAQQEAVTDHQVTVGIRPEDLSPAAEGTGVPITVEVVEELGADAYVYGQLAPLTAATSVVRVDPSAHAADHSIDSEEEGADGGASPIVVRTDGRTPPSAGSTLWVAPDPERIHLFDAATGNRLPS